jgi:predicted nucleic acid-binding protein
VLPFAGDAARSYARIAAERRRVGKPISQADAQIAAIADAAGGKLATRNVADFTHCGIDVVDPWR